MWDALFDGNAAWFAIPALLGTAIFVLRLGMVLLGGHDTDFDHGGVGDTHAGDHPDSGDALRLLTVEGGASFFMGLGWGGLAGLKGFGWSLGGSMGAALVCGLGLLLMQAVLLRAVHRLQTSGNVSIKDTVGLSGVVYVSIPGANKGGGLVTLVVGGKQRQFNALSEGGEELPSQTRVSVVRVNDDNTVTVRRSGSA